MNRTQLKRLADSMEPETKFPTLPERMKRDGITTIVRPSDVPCPWDEGKFKRDSWKVTLKYNGHQLTTDFFTGKASNWLGGGDPDDKEHGCEVLSCLLSDAESTRSAVDFEDWCSGFGYDPDSRKAEKIYRACLRTYYKLRRFLGISLLEEYLYETEAY